MLRKICSRIFTRQLSQEMSDWQKLQAMDSRSRFTIPDLPEQKAIAFLHPSIELKIIDISGDLYVTSPLLHRDDLSVSKIKHVINLFLELFGSCEILTENLLPAISSIPTTRVNWRILPEGQIF